MLGRGHRRPGPSSRLERRTDIDEEHAEARHDPALRCRPPPWPRRTGPGSTGRAETTRRTRRACCGHGRRKGRRCSGRYRWAPASAAPPSVAETCTCSTGTRRSGTRCACSISRAARSCGRLPMTRPAASCSRAHGRRRPSTASTSTPSDRWGICTRSARRPASPPGARTSGRTSAAAPSCRGGRSCRTR